MIPAYRHAAIGSAFVFAIISSTVVLAAEPNPGLWQQTTTTAISGMSMPALPPDVLAQMQAAGVQMPNMGQPQTRTSQFCITPEEIANREPFADELEDNCTQQNFQMDDNGMSVDIVCTGETAGTMHIEYLFVSATHFTGMMTMQGSRQGMNMNSNTEIDATWVASDCGNVD
jgi:hypothetical protein